MEKKIIIAVRCENCGKWNTPKVRDDGRVVYPKACVRNTCRSVTYMKARKYVRQQKQERARNLQSLLKKIERQTPKDKKNIAAATKHIAKVQRERSVTMQQLYNSVMKKR